MKRLGGSLVATVTVLLVMWAAHAGSSSSTESFAPGDGLAAPAWRHAPPEGSAWANRSNIALTELGREIVVPPALQEARFELAPFLREHPVFASSGYTALGVVAGRTPRGPVADVLSGAGSELRVCVLAGAVQRDHGREPGPSTRVRESVLSAVGGDAVISGNPEVGDIVRWHPLEGYGYGWVAFLSPSHARPLPPELTCDQLTAAGR